MSEIKIVTTPSLFAIDDEFNDERFMKIRICAMHSGVNLNSSKFSVETILDAQDTFKNIPILAYVSETVDENGNPVLDYTSHEMHIENDFYTPDEQRVIYDECCVGVIPESNNFEMIKDEESGNYYVYVDGLLYRAYGNYVCDILKSRGGKTDVSMEIICDDIVFDANEHVLVVNKMAAHGVTLLSAQTQPGMAKAHAVAFSLDEDRRSEQMLKIMQELKDSLDNYITNFEKKKEGCEVDNTENIVPAEAPVEEVTFEEEKIDEVIMSDEDVEEKKETLEEEKDFSEIESDSIEESLIVDLNANSEDDTINSEDLMVSFAISHEDLRWALYNALHAIYGDDYGIVCVYDDYFIVSDFELPGNFYKISYVKDANDIITLDEMVKVNAEFLTDAESDALKLMRSSYKEMEERIKEYEIKEARSEKMEKVFNNNDYSMIKDSKEFAELQNNMDAYSLDDIVVKADVMLANYAKKNMLSFEKHVVGNVHMVNLDSGRKTDVKKPYGGIFEDYFNNKNIK